MSQQINLCNPLFRKQEKYFSAITMVQSLAIILLGALLFYAYLQYQYRDLAKQAQQMSLRQTEAQQQLTQVASTMGPRKPSQALLDSVAETEHAVQAQQVILGLLKTGEMANQTGFSAYFQALSRQTVHGLWLTGFDVVGMGSQISINGRAMQAELIPQFIGKLKNEPQFVGANFTALEIAPPKPVTTNTTDTPPVSLPYTNFTLTNVVAEPAK
ncbi:PilN domain-containing protein [Sulfuriferula nivalis]|uniref:MSHA biogenesis protein MshI n=1 Tax=Sulfuriferula nivalis TaxID=2675298 RepID=A0A809RKP4_9PROT|nr:PilN domain-containing protein [Sulfuriferula nivalis]BBP01374.1 hypothetical protein SFSGTM_20820 [Sulfuriferula nivalis]